MYKYHKQIGYNPQDIKALISLCENLNTRQFKITSHAINQIKDKGLPIESIGLFLKDYKINYNDIFEYKKDDFIKQIGIRKNLNSQWDIILILSSDKSIITLWFNNANDKHYTLNVNEYSRP
jgi:hypothetical protein